jgi:hypothetical protein
LISKTFNIKSKLVSFFNWIYNQFDFILKFFLIYSTLIPVSDFSFLLL